MELPMPGEAQLIIHRGTRRFGILRRLTVYLDGNNVAKLRRNESVDLRVDPGSHTIRVRMDWSRSEDMRVETRDGSRTVIQADVSHPALVAPFYGLFHPKGFWMLAAEQDDEQ
jgi:hypothetical protein